MPSCERLSVAITTSAPAFRWNASHESTMSISSRARSVITSVTAAPVYDVPRAPLARARRAGPRARWTRCSARTIPSISTSTDASAAYAASSSALGRGNVELAGPTSGSTNAPSSVADRAQRVAQARVDGERAVVEAAGESLVVDRERVVERLARGLPAAPRRGGADARSARSPGCEASRPRLASELRDRAEGEVRGPRAGARHGGPRIPAPRRCGCPPRSRPRRLARWATFWWAWKIVSLSPGWAGVARRTVMRSAKNAPSSGRGRK